MKKRTRESFVPDITPLIDVVFLLLIFFMVSTVFKKNELALMMSLPQATSDDKTSRVLNTFYIEVSRNEIAFNGKKTNLNSIEDQLRKIKNKNSYMELRIDRDVKYNRVITLLDLLKNNKLHNLALITDQN
ncbi:MAG: biopolymer transporter ExbD [Bacteriovoracaceae bacterium]|nr:biopolymer transporter ExbD [Bacteriovoracaceae bacterium]